MLCSQNPHTSVLPVDILCDILKLFQVAYLVHLKTVSLEWASAVRRALRNKPNRLEMTLIPTGVCRYESAQEAFRSLRAGRRLDRRLVTKKCRMIANIYDIKLHSCNAEYALFGLFDKFKIFERPVRVLQLDDTDKIIVFSDVNCVHDGSIYRFAQRCVLSGVSACAFEKEYPGLDPSRSYNAPLGTKMICKGRTYFCRGRIAGVVV